MIRRTTRAAALLFILQLIAGCGDHVDPEPVAECIQYESAISACFHRPPSGFARQASLIPKTKNDLARIREECRANLDRAKSACR
jgi:hypothetical protein